MAFTDPFILTKGTGSDFRQDPNLITWWEPPSLIDKAPSSGLGNAVQISGGPLVGTGVDGQPIWQFRKTGGKYLYSAVTQALNNVVFFPPLHILFVAQVPATFTPASGDTWINVPPGNSGLWIDWLATTRLGLGGSINLPGTPASPQLWDLYLHRTYTKLSINGGTAVSITGVSASFLLAGIALGIFGSAFVNPADMDLSFLQFWEGQISASSKSGVYSYLAAKFPSLGIGAAPAQIDLSAPAIGGLFNAANPWKFIAVGGQSNIKNFSTVAPAASPAANTFRLARDYVYRTFINLYDTATNERDEVSTDALPVGAAGGIGTALMNAAVARYAQPVVWISGAKAGSFSVPPYSNTIAVVPNQIWMRDFQRGNAQRNALYWSLAFKIKDAISKNGTFAYLVWYQGEAEGAQGNPSYPNQLAAYTLSMLTSLFTDLNLPMRVIVVIPPSTVPALASASNWAIMRAQLATLDNGATIRTVNATNGPFEPGNLHLQGSACDSTGAAIDAMAASMGW